MKDSFIFSLDIGTRSVVGIILQEMNGKYQIIDMLAKEHEERAMLDGQIHDVPAVAKVISSIKHELEKKHGPLHKVCVAAAGRALKTKRTKAMLDISGIPLIQHKDILHLELNAVQQAQYELARGGIEDESTDYYCVGYSVIHYFLDNDPIGQLEGHQGKEAAVEIIATFLPKIVVESLLSALQRAELEMEALTLEPIAAINVLIPSSMRRLNIALIDIGAGTSDVAITDEGSITAYGMVPIAGDEITEAMSDAYLLDFPVAEKAKRALLTETSVTFTDVLGFETTVQKDEAVAAISDAVDRLAQSITTEILHLNGHAPKAVMIVGGGSLTPELPARLAEKLSLPTNRVAIRGIEAIQHLHADSIAVSGPDLVTPIGIAIAAKQNPVHYISVTVNSRPVRLFDMRKLTIGDSLLAAGIEMNKLYGKPGMAKVIKVNGRTITLPGTHGTPPVIEKNEEAAELGSEIKNGDKIIVKAGQDGETPHVKASDLIEVDQNAIVFFNDKKMSTSGQLTVNGKPANPAVILEDRDEVKHEAPQTIEELLNVHGFSAELKAKDFTVTLNSQQVQLIDQGLKLTKNGKPIDKNSSFLNGDVIEAKQEKGPIRVKHLLAKAGIQLEKTLPIMFNGSNVTLRKQAGTLLRDGVLLEENDEIMNRDQLQYVPKEDASFIFQDVFRHVEIDLSEKKAGRFKLTRNGAEVSFYEPLTSGDELMLEWETASNKLL